MKRLLFAIIIAAMASVTINSEGRAGGQSQNDSVPKKNQDVISVSAEGNGEQDDTSNRRIDLSMTWRLQLQGQSGEWSDDTLKIQKGENKVIDISAELFDKKDLDAGETCVNLHYSADFAFSRNKDTVVDTYCSQSLTPLKKKVVQFDGFSLKDLGVGKHYFFVSIKQKAEQVTSNNAPGQEKNGREYVEIEVVAPAPVAVTPPTPPAPEVKPPQQTTGIIEAYCHVKGFSTKQKWVVVPVTPEDVYKIYTTYDVKSYLPKYGALPPAKSGFYDFRITKKDTGKILTTLTFVMR